jgi:N-methylhydantoinase A
VSAEAIDAARGIVDVATASMARAIRVVTVERGHDPRERALVAFGGAGPVHATALAAAVGMERVLLPARAGVLSAVGILATDEVATERVSRVTSWAAIDPGTLADTMAGLRRDAGARLSDPDDALASFHVDLRYDGQAHELRIPVDVEDEADIDGDALDRTADRFHERHRERYGHAAPEEPIELVTVRVRVRRPVEPPDLRRHDPGTSLGEARVGRRPVWFDGRQETPVYDWAALPAGADLDGPAIVAADTSTALLRPSDAARVLDDGSLRVEVGDA